jgi:ribosome recycling factor
MDKSLDIDTFMSKGKKSMQDALDHLQHELMQIRAGKASPAMLQGIAIDYYGNPTPLNQASNVSTPDAKTISIQPWDKSLLSVIEQAIFKANLGLTPMNDGEFIRINIPPLTEERRILLVKQAKKLGEEAKVSLRNGRHKIMDFIKTEVKEGYPEDAGKRKEKEVEDLVQAYYDKVDKLIELKEKDIMTV